MMEGYLNIQKFYLLSGLLFGCVDWIKQGDSFGLVDIGKLWDRETLEPQENSLAMKVETQNELSHSCIDYLQLPFGRTLT